jgi:hypothetical protein
MNNISYPQGWGKQEIKDVNVHWNTTYLSEPKHKDVYLVTISINNDTTLVSSSYWNGNKWDCEELIGKVLAYANYPAPYFKSK